MSFNSSNNSSFCGGSNQTLLQLVHNLTIFYADADLRGAEAPLVATSVLMFSLAVLFLVLNIFSRYSDVSATLNPSVRLFFSAALSLFLPAMSYLFSEAKDTSKEQGGDLSVRARIILMWMLLVELLRKKVEAILITAGGTTQGYSAMVQRATGVVLLGNFVFFSLKSAGKKALYGMVWVFVAAKFVQRSVAIEVGKRSLAYGKNPQLVAAYMPAMLEVQQEQEQQPERRHRRGSSELLRRCNYAVMGEEELVDENNAGPKGYKIDKHNLELELQEETTTTGGHSSAVVTVGRVWRLADSDKLLSSEPRLKRLCLSFALFKLLRRRLEGYPISGAEAADCHRLIFHGLLEEPASADGEHAFFQVFTDEVHFLCENYHSVVPVVLASPFFFAHNYVLFPVVVLALCFLMLVLSGNGDVAYAVRSLRCDNFFTSGNVASAAGYVLSRVLRSTTLLFCAIDLCTTALLAVAVAYEEVAEYVVFLFSNWFVVSLLCHHTSRHEWRAEAGVLRRVIPGVLMVRNTLTHPALAVKRVSLLWSRCLLPLPLPLPLPSAAVPGEAKALIVERLARVGSHGAALTSGTAALYKDEHCASVRSDELAWACGGGVAEVMLTWHVATAMLEARCARRRRQQHAPPEPGRAAAMALSGYCAYLVAFRPELLPDDKDGTEVLFKEMKKELTKEVGGWCGYYRGGEAARCARLMAIARGSASAPATTMTVLEKGARLGKVLIGKYKEGAREAVWRLLGDLWTEVVVYAAPAAGELHVKSHKEALAQGAELITVLWAITTHTGVARPEEEVQQHPPAPATTV